MDIISLLPDSVANQIAAGEVIQRPASVVKELVENAVDAGAKAIHVLVVDAGRTSIQVIDDGRGMSPTDARLAFERHATSKIRKADDLFNLHTMGFRGEALASIAAVAQVELLTRTAQDEIGTHISMAGSRVIDQQPEACPVGSNFRVENIFYNVPARRKFLKSNATELNNIITTFERIVLVYPDIHFTLHSNGTEMLNLRPGNLLQRITDVMGHQFAQELLPVEADTQLCRVSGFVTKPEAARKRGGQDHFFVNGRFMKHPYFHKAVLTAYDRLLPEGMQPPYFLYFDITPTDIDVNIHPTKTEIKFENEQAIWQILMAAVRDAIGKFCEIPTIDFDTEGRPDIPIFDPGRDNIAAPRVEYNPAYNPFASASTRHSEPSASSETSEFPEFSGFPEFSDYAEHSEFPEHTSPAAPELFPSLLTDHSPLHYQYKGRYIMTAVKSGLMIIDQYRASVRILFDQYQTTAVSAAVSAAVPSARLLFPESIELSPADGVLMESLLPQLSTLGFDLSSLGGNVYAVNGIPSGLEGMSPIPLLQQLLADAAAHDTATPTLSIAQTLHLSLARSAAVPYGQILSNDEMESLVNDLFACSNVNYTPDGKAILAIFPQADIDRLLA